VQGKLVALAMIAILAVTTGCFGYNRSAKRWAYVGDTVLILGGGAAIGLDVTSEKPDQGMTTTAAKPYDPALSGVMLTGIILAAAGVFGIFFNATRPIVKTSR
jgi:hypothetical protein